VHWHATTGHHHAVSASAEYRRIRIPSVRQCHTDTVDLPVVGYTGNQLRPRALVVELPDGRRALSQRLDPRTSADTAAYLTRAEPGGLAHTGTGELYTTTSPGLIVEAAAGTTRHAVVTITRVR
jgi:hypothetical protein